MTRWLLGALLVVGCLALSRPAVSPSLPANPVAFSVTVTSTPTGWAARCDTGCHWTQGSFNCRAACAAVLDANGMVTSQTVRTEPSDFAFRLERTPTGFSAIAERGTLWRTVSRACRSRSCTGRIDATGVAP